MTQPIRSEARARRLARVLVSDVVTYAGDQVRIGLEKDDLFERLHSEIERVRDYYWSKVDAELPGARRILDFAIVDVLVAGNRKVQTHIW
jgi:hypothetical protein